MAELGKWDFAKQLGETAFNSLQDQRINSGGSFMAGGATTLFAASNNVISAGEQAMGAISYNSNNVISSIQAGQSLLNTVTNSEYWNQYADFGKEMAKKIEDSVVKFVSEDIKKIAKEKKDELIQTSSQMATYLVSRTAYWTGANTMSFSDILAMFTKDQKSEQDKEDEKENKQKLQNTISQIKETANSVTKIANDSTALVRDGITQITAYIQNGPKWIESNTNKLIKQIDKTIKGQIDSYTALAIEMGYDTIESLAKKAGAWAGEKANKILEAKARKMQAKIEKAKETAISFAKAALQLVKQKAMALIGM